MRPLLALLLAALCALAPAQEPAAPPPGRVVCPTCTGEGVAEQACLACYDGSLPCPDCNLFYDRYDDLVFRRSEHVEADAWTKQRTGLGATRPMATALGKRVASPGKLPCPMGCATLPYGTSRGTCHVCEGTQQIACVTCRDVGGMRPCATCAATGVVTRLCDDCLGAGTLPDPLASAAAGTRACLWCDGTGVRGCDACDAHGKARVACATCLADGERDCPTCYGTSQAPCQDCFATGQVRRSGGSKKLTTCKTCRKRGWVKCEACKKGVAACADCEGEGTREDACPACEGDKTRPCAGCFRGQYRQCEVNARLCADAGEVDQAVGWYDEALLRVGQRRTTSLAWCRGADADRALQARAIDARRDAERARVQALREALATRKEAGR